MFNFSLENTQKSIFVAAFLAIGGWALFLTVENVFFYIDADLAGEISQPSAPIVRLENQEPAGPGLSTLGLFGEVSTQPSEVEIDAPTTRLNLELQGVFLSDIETASSAIVAERGKDGKLYQIGEKLPGLAILHAVASDHILLRRGTRLEKLLFISKRLNIQGSNTDSRQKIATANAAQQSTIDSVRQRSIRNDRPSKGSALGLSAVRDRLLENPNQLLKEYGLSSVSPGTRQGYKVDTAHPALANTGLQPGDRVVSVNGAPLGMAMNDARLIDQARSAGRVRVEVERDGRRFFLTIPIP
jgi:general secretion pathway protein C